MNDDPAGPQAGSPGPNDLGSFGPADGTHVGTRDLTHWPTRFGRWLVHLAAVLARAVSAESVLVIPAVVGVGIAAALLVGGAEIYDAVEDGDGIAGLDRPALARAMALRTTGNTRLITWFTHLGGSVGMSVIAAVVTAVMVWRWRSRTPLLMMLLAVAGSLTMTTVGKAVVGRPRPPLVDAVPPYEYAFSFPSGHALNSTVIATVVAHLVITRLRRRVARILTGLAAAAWWIAMGLSRVFLGHHWLTDVIFAWVVGLAWAGLLITAHRLLLTLRHHPRQQHPSGPEPDRPLS